MSIPYQIQAIMEQLGSGLRGARAYVGASQLTYSCKQESGGGESKVLENGLVDAPVALTFNVNGKKGAGWKIIISIEPSDTYTVRLWKPVRVSAKKVAEGRWDGKNGEILDESTDIYCDQLQESVERMYDRAIQKHSGGFIPLN
jgi:hypothetical protein